MKCEKPPVWTFLVGINKKLVKRIGKPQINTHETHKIETLIKQGLPDLDLAR